jgi:hypothetical protein
VTAAQQPVSKDHGIHGPGAGAGDPDDIECLIFQKPIEHTPGERAVRATTL